VPGVVDPDTGRVVVTPNMSLTGVAIGAHLEGRFHVPVAIGNDGNLGTLGETWLGSARKADSALGIWVGTGIGAGFVQKGRLWRGARESACEIGHIVMQIGGPKCGCGNHGCLEAVASRSAIVRRIVTEIEEGRKSLVTELCDGDLRRIRSRILAKAYHDGDKLVREVIHDACDHIGHGAANLINMLNPQAVILGGGVIEALGPVMLPRIRRAAWRHVIGATDERVNIVDSGLGDDAGILGSALAARQMVKP
jgi:glucokinase